jgi:hypothetical protein
LPLLLAKAASFGFVLEILLVEKTLLSGGEYEIRPAIHALESSVLKF